VRRGNNGDPNFTYLLHLREEFAMTRWIIAAMVGTLLCTAAVQAGDTPEAKTLLTQRGALIFADDFSQPPAKPWNVAKGQWKAVDGAVEVKELKSDMHGAVARRALPQADFIVQYSFKLDGAKQTTLSINDPKGHCCRALVNAAGLSVQKDSHDKNKLDKAAVLDRQPAAIAPGKWHTLVVEVLGPEIVASVDGQLVAFSAHDSIKVTKNNIGLTVAGESASFKDLRVWEAKPNSTWEATKAGLAKDRAKTASVK
jgi:hypothetical protein